MQRDERSKSRRQSRRDATRFLDPLITIINRDPFKVRLNLAWRVLLGNVRMRDLADPAQRAMDPNAPRGRLVIIPPKEG